jgi:hypothetical protein
MTPHPELRRLYSERAAVRDARSGTLDGESYRRAAMDLEHRIHLAELRHGRGVFTFKRCAVCNLLHEVPDRVAISRCDGAGLWIYQAWLRNGGPDLCVIVE